MVALSSLVAATKIFNKSLTLHVQAPAPGGTAAAAQTAPAGQPAAAQASSGSNTGAIAGGVVGGVVVVALLALAAAYFARRQQRRAHREEPVSPYKDFNGSMAGVLALQVSVGHACWDHSRLVIMFLSSLMAIHLVLRQQRRAHREDPAQPCKDCSFKARVLALEVSTGPRIHNLPKAYTRKQESAVR